MKRTVIFLSLLCLLVSCQTKEEKALSEYKAFYEEIKQYEDSCTSEEYEQICEVYDQMELELSECEFSKEQKHQLNKLKGQIFTVMMKIKAKVVVDELGNFMDGAASFINGVASEINRDDD